MGLSRLDHSYSGGSLKATRFHGVVTGSDFAGRIMLLSCWKAVQPKPDNKNVKADMDHITGNLRKTT